MKMQIIHPLALPAALFLLAACTQLPPPGNAQIESVGMTAANTHRPSDIDQLTAWARQGSPVAQRELALACLNWPGHEDLARDWLLKAAEGGDADAQFHLADALYKGSNGLRVNHLLAWEWYRKAARSGNGKASFMLARMAKYGDGTPQDLRASIQWLQVSSGQGNAQAMFLLSNAYSAGEGIEQDETKAREWLEKSAAGDFPVAIQALAMSLDTSDKKVNTGGEDNATRAHHLIKEAADERLMNWRNYQ